MSRLGFNPARVLFPVLSTPRFTVLVSHACLTHPLPATSNVAHIGRDDGKPPGAKDGKQYKTPQKSALRSFIRQEQPQTGVSQPVRFETWPRAGLSICRITSCSHRLRGFEQDSAALGGRPAHSCDRRTCLTEQQTTNV